MSPDVAREAIRNARLHTHRQWTPPVDRAIAPHDLAPAIRVLGADTAAMALERALAAPADPAALFDAGYQLIEIGLDDLATAPLAAALALRPGHVDTVSELAVALEAAGRHDQAAALFAANPAALDASDVLRGLYSHDAAMAGDFDAVRRMLPTLGPDGQAGYFHSLAAARLARFDALSAIGRPRAGDLVGWELVLHGTLVLALSDFGDEMNGRYGALWEQSEAFARGLALLEGALALRERPVSAVFHAPDRDSEIFAWALATRLGLGPPASIADTPPTPGAVVLEYPWGESDQNTLARFADIPDVTLVGYVLNWPARDQLTPDLVVVEAQFASGPWAERMRVVGQPGSPDSRVDTEPADARAAHEVGADAAAVAGDDVSADLAELSVLVDALRAAGAPCGLFGGPRQRFYPGGPVGSAVFA